MACEKFGSWEAKGKPDRTNCSVDRSDVFKGRSYLFLKHHDARRRDNESGPGARSEGAVHDKVDLFFSHPTPGLSQGLDEVF